MAKKMENDLWTIWMIVKLIMAIIEQWKKEQITAGGAAKRIQAILNKQFKDSVKSEAATAEIVSLFAPSGKFGGVLNEIASIGKIVDAIIEILRRIFDFLDDDKGVGITDMF